MGVTWELVGSANPKPHPDLLKQVITVHIEFRKYYLPLGILW